MGPFAGQALFQSLELIIAHTYRGDIEVYLTSPSGQKRAMLVNAPTAQAAGSNFGNPGACPGVVLQLRDDGTNRVRDNIYTRNSVRLSVSNAVEFAVKPGAEPRRSERGAIQHPASGGRPLGSERGAGL